MTALTIILLVIVCALSFKVYGNSQGIKDIKKDLTDTKAINKAMWQMINERARDKAKAKRDKQRAVKIINPTGKNSRGKG